MLTYEVVIIDTSGREVRSETVQAESFEDALGVVVPDSNYYLLMQPTEEKVKSYQSREYLAKVFLV
jgi:hypothetical protein